MAGNAAAGAGVGPGMLHYVLGITKAYCTRVGGGPFPTELLDAVGDGIRTRGREFGTTTGRPRRVGWLDLVAVRYASMICGATGIACTLLDVLSGLDELKIATSYREGDRRRDWFPADAATLAKCLPSYESMPGWREDITGCRKWNELPANARAYVSRISTIMGVPIHHVSVGPDRAQTLLVD